MNANLIKLQLLDLALLHSSESMKLCGPHCRTFFAVGDVNGLGLLDSVAVAQARVAVGVILGKKIQFSWKMGAPMRPY